MYDCFCVELIDGVYLMICGVCEIIMNWFGVVIVYVVGSCFCGIGSINILVFFFFMWVMFCNCIWLDWVLFIVLIEMDWEVRVVFVVD